MAIPSSAHQYEREPTASMSSASSGHVDITQSHGPLTPGVVPPFRGSAQLRVEGSPALDAQVAHQSHQLCRETLGRAFASIQEAVEAA